MQFIEKISQTRRKTELQKGVCFVAGGNIKER
jgi:hypothetical protein